jgi:hypothetical protein
LTRLQSFFSNRQTPQIKLHIAFLIDINKIISNAMILDILSEDPKDIESFQNILDKFAN